MSESHEAAIALLPAVGHAQCPASGTSKSTAIDYHRQRMEYARYCKDKVGETEAARGLGHTVRWFDGHEEGLEEWHQALQQAQRVGDYQTACAMMDRIGQVCLEEKNEERNCCLASWTWVALYKHVHSLHSLCSAPHPGLVSRHT